MISKIFLPFSNDSSINNGEAFRFFKGSLPYVFNAYAAKAYFSLKQKN